MRWGDYPGLSGWAQYNHNGPGKKGQDGQFKMEGQKCSAEERRCYPTESEDGGKDHKQACRRLLGAIKGKDVDSPPKAFRRNQPYQTP